MAAKTKETMKEKTAKLEKARELNRLRAARHREKQKRLKEDLKILGAEKKIVLLNNYNKIAAPDPEQTFPCVFCECTGEYEPIGVFSENKAAHEEMIKQRQVPVLREIELTVLEDDTPVKRKLKILQYFDHKMIWSDLDDD